MGFFFIVGRKEKCYSQFRRSLEASYKVKNRLRIILSIPTPWVYVSEFEGHKKKHIKSVYKYL